MNAECSSQGRLPRGSWETPGQPSGLLTSICWDWRVAPQVSRSLPDPLCKAPCSPGHNRQLSPCRQGRHQTQGCSQVSCVLLLKLLESKLSAHVFCEVITEMGGDWEDRERERAGSAQLDHWLSYYWLNQVPSKEKLPAGGDSKSILNLPYHSKSFLELQIKSF